MTDLLAAAARALAAPETIVKRSAEARAKATGASLDDVLAAWAGGGTVAVSAPAASAPAAAVAAPAPVAATSPPAAAAVLSPSAAAVPVEEPVAAPAMPPAAAPGVVALEPPVEQPVEAAPLGARLRLAGRIGATAGLFAGLLVIVFAAQWLAPRATLLGEEGALRPAVEVVPGWVVLGSGLLAAALGVAVAGLTRSATGWGGRGMRLTGSWWATSAVGALTGLAIGVLTGAVVTGAGSPVEGVEGVTVVPVLAGTIWNVAGYVLAGWLIGLAVQAVGVPEGVAAAEAAEAGTVRRRLATAFSTPLIGAVSILFLVLPIAVVFIEFPQWAPLLALFVAGSILGFAGLSASRPGVRISRGEFAVAAAGIGVVVAIVVAVLATQGGGHGDDTPEEGEAEAVAAVVLV